MYSHPNKTSEKLTELFAAKFGEILGMSLIEYCVKSRIGTYRYKHDGTKYTYEEALSLATASFGTGENLTIQVRAEKDQKKASLMPNQYPDYCDISFWIYDNDKQVVSLFGCVIQGTQHNCGMKEMVKVTALGSYAGAGVGNHTESGYKAISLGFDLVKYVVKKFNSRELFNYAIPTGILVMSQDENSFITKIAREHKMWDELLTASNPIYGGETHKFVLFSANIHNEYGDRIKREKAA